MVESLKVRNAWGQKEGRRAQACVCMCGCERKRESERKEGLYFSGELHLFVGN